MSTISDSGFDALLNWIKTNGTRLDVCTTEPTTYAEATSTYTLAHGSVTLTGPADASPDGRKITVPAVAAMTASGTGTGAYWALTDGSSVLVATGSMSASRSITSGDTVNVATFDISVDI